MILPVPDIVNEIRKITDETIPAFVGWPADVTDAADNWGNLMVTVTAGMVPVASSASARAALVAGIITNVPTMGMPGLQAAFQAFAVAYAATYGTATPPPLPPDFSLVQTAGFGGMSASACALIMAQEISDWLQTGSYTDFSGTYPWS